MDLPEEGFIFAHSDGLTEQENDRQEAYSFDRVVAVIESQPDDLLEAFSQSLFMHAGHSTYSDDVSACTINPSLVFKDMNDPVSLSQHRSLSPIADDRFEWSVQLCGRQLESCEIPPLCNHFLQQVGVDQQVCQKIFAVLAEMVSNALDHGVLGLSSSLKESADGFTEYFHQREERLKTLTDNDFVKLSIRWLSEGGEGRFLLEVEDSGAGYALNDAPNSVTPKYSGRGNQLIRKLSDSVEIIPPGNKIRATIK